MAEDVKNEETIEETQPTPQESSGEEKPLDKMTAPELREVAKQIPGITGASAMKKEALLALIKKHRGIKDEEAKKKPAIDAKTLKKKVLQLHQEKDQAREAGEKKKIDILRRRINRIKKQTRRAAKER